MRFLIARFWAFLTDHEVGATAFLVAVAIFYSLIFFRIADGRADCDSTCEELGYSRVIFEPRAWRNGFDASCTCVDPDGESIEPW